ncbi:unnamed protein product, partial [Hymenolepis diminuta]
RLKRLTLAILEGKDIHKFPGIVNRICNAFSYGSLKEDQFRASLPTRIWLKAMKLEHVKSINSKSTETLKITRHCSRGLRGSTRTPITLIIINRSAIFWRFLIPLRISIKISARTAIRTGTRKDFVRAVNDDCIQATGEATIRINITKRMAY